MIVPKIQETELIQQIVLLIKYKSDGDREAVRFRRRFKTKNQPK